jgi:hypothetical protein
MIGVNVDKPKKLVPHRAVISPGPETNDAIDSSKPR